MQCKESTMPLPLAPLIVVVAGLVGSAVIARMVRKEWKRINAKLHAATDATDRDRMPKLKRDPETGVYRAE
jgi:hypothetical protein